jgi:hypothetical protein
MLSLFDESSQFLGSFGRYTNGGSSYDRGVYLELFNGKDEYIRDLCNKSTHIVNPRLNLCMLGHPSSFFKLMREELGMDDGLMQRFLSISPSPCFSDSDFIEKAGQNPRPFTLTTLLFNIQLFHNFVDNEETVLDNRLKKVVTYKMEGESKIFFKQTYSEYREVSKKMHDHDIFIR